MIRFLYLLPISIVSILGISQGEERVVSYNREVRPILSENCFTCHGFDKDKREADLRLDTEKGAKESAIVAGNAKASELFKRIVSRDPDEVMPPADSIYKLTPSQVETLQLWIDQGAKYEEKRFDYPPLGPHSTDLTACADHLSQVDPPYRYPLAAMTRLKGSMKLSHRATSR